MRFRLKPVILAVIVLVCVLATSPAWGREWKPKAVVDGVYAGIQHIHGYKATPRIIWDLPQGYRGRCGRVSGSHYCTRDHTVYIARADIRAAYQHGDAALAYIIGHEYAHAMQTAFGFGSSKTPISELQADCLAGVYLGLIPNIVFDQDDIVEIGSFAHRIGDYDWWSHHHHGTPEQRVQAVVIGIKASLNGKKFDACRVDGL